MVLIILCLIGLAVGIALKIFTDFDADIIYIISGIFLICFLTFIISMYIQAPSNKASNDEIYKALVYKAETELVKDDLGIVRKSIVDDIQEWNTDVAMFKALKKNIFTNVFIPDYLSNYKKIEYERVN
jgi:hypothetical protein